MATREDFERLAEYEVRYNFDVPPEDAEALNGLLKYIVEEATILFTGITESRVPRPTADFTVKDIARLMKRMKEGTFDSGLPLELQTAVIGVFERSLEHERAINAVYDALKLFKRILRSYELAHAEEALALERAVTHLAKTSAREEGDGEAVREINRTRRKAGRSRRK